MLCHLITCNGYRVVKTVTVRDFSELPALCRAEEDAAGDGYAVDAWHDSRVVADSDGVIEPEPNDVIYQGGYAYACGYRD